MSAQRSVKATILSFRDSIILTKLDVAEQIDGKAADWMEQVSDEEYQAGSSAG